MHAPTPREAARQFPDIAEPPADYSLSQRAEFLDERRKMLEEQQSQHVQTGDNPK